MGGAGCWKASVLRHLSVELLMLQCMLEGDRRRLLSPHLVELCRRAPPTAPAQALGTLKCESTTWARQGRPGARSSLASTDSAAAALLPGLKSRAAGPRSRAGRAVCMLRAPPDLLCGAAPCGRSLRLRASLLRLHSVHHHRYSVHHHYIITELSTEPVGCTGLVRALLRKQPPPPTPPTHTLERAGWAGPRGRRS